MRRILTPMKKVFSFRKTHKGKTFFQGVSLLVCLSLVLSACNLPQSKDEPEGQLNVTQAYQTVEARLTEAALLTPTSAPTATQTPEPSPTSTPASQTPAPTKANTQPAVAGCDQAAAGNPIDVSIPDDTKMLPGQTFTKTWRLQNAGTCTWTTAYSIAFFSGESMGALASVPMPKNVAPGESVDISVDMVAPQTAGTYLGNWKLRNASNTWFGIGAGNGLPFWVKIIVTSSAGTITPTVTLGTPGTPTVTNTPVPDVQASGKKTLIAGDRINLDNNTINSGAGEDVSWVLDAEEHLSLTPLGSAVLGIFGSTEPTLGDCQSAVMSGAPIPREFMNLGMYLCYRTDLGLYGWLKLQNFKEEDLSLVIHFVTFAAP